MDGWLRERGVIPTFVLFFCRNSVFLLCHVGKINSELDYDEESDKTHNGR